MKYNEFKNFTNGMVVGAVVTNIVYLIVFVAWKLFIEN